MKTNMPVSMKCRLATLPLGKMECETPPARQKLSDGKPMATYVKKKKNCLIDRFPEAAI